MKNKLELEFDIDVLKEAFKSGKTHCSNVDLEHFKNSKIICQDDSTIEVLIIETLWKNMNIN